jgi:epoxyqueuosine reductase QueG
MHEHVAMDDTDRAWVSIRTLLTGDDDAVLGAVGRWYVPQRDLNVVRRNALVVLGNIGHPTDEIRAILVRYLRHEDATLRAHAVWASARLGLVNDLPADDDHDIVRDELRSLPCAR